MLRGYPPFNNPGQAPALVFSIEPRTSVLVEGGGGGIKGFIFSQGEPPFI